MIIFEQQRIPHSKKDKTWRKNNMDAICSRVDEFGDDWFRMWQNYRLKNNQINQEEFREYCDTLGLQNGEGHKFVEPFNKTHTIIDVLVGEESSMPWNFDVINLSPKATNEILRQKERDIRNYVDEMLTMEAQRAQEMVNVMVQAKSQNLDPQTAEEEMQKIQEKYQKREATILNPSDIDKKYSKYKSLKERAMHKMLKSLAVINNIKWIKNQTFEDAIIAGIEAVEIVVDEYTKVPKIKQINPLNLFFHKSSDNPFIHQSDYVGYKEEMTIADVLDKYGEHLEEKDVKRLKQYNNNVFGTDEKFHSPHGESVSHWDYLKKYEYTYRHPLSTIPSYGTTNVVSEGLYAADRYRGKYENYAVVYTAYWKSQRRVGKLTYTNEYNKPETTIVSEEYKVPKEASKVSHRPHTFSKLRSRYEWVEEGRKFTLEWIYVPEIWKGTRINGDIYVKIEPHEHAYQSLLNPYKVKLPIHGFIYNNRNAFSVSTMDRIKPWQKLYFVVASRWLKLITQDKGVVQLLNILMMDKKLGYEKSLQIAVDQGVLPYNPLAHSQGAGLGSTAKPAERLDLSNSQQLTHYTNMLQFIEEQIKLAAGIPNSRLAQTSTSTNVTDNQRDVQQSMNITNSLFKAHELLWQEILQSLCETAAKTLNSQSGFVRQILSDDEIALIDLDLISMEDEYAVRVGNNTRAHQVLMQAKGLAQALIQNDKANFSTLLDLLDNDNLQEFKAELRAIEEDIEEREAQMQQQQQQQQMEMQKMAEADKERDRKHELDKIQLQKEYDIKIAQIKAMSWNPEKDMDRDGLPDIFEIEKFRNEAAEMERQAEIKNRELDQSDRQLALKEKELIEKQRDSVESRQSQERQKQDDLRARDRISQRQERTKVQQAKEKAKADKAKAKQKPNK